MLTEWCPNIRSLPESSNRKRPENRGMHFMNSKYIAPLCLAVALLGARFQLAAATADNNNLWLSYVGDHSFFGSPLGGASEGPEPPFRLG